MTSWLIGGGWEESAARQVYGPFLAAAGPDPVVACLLIDEGDGEEYFARFAAALRSVAPCTPRPVLVPIGAALDPSALDGADALLVGGGLTPAYQEALAASRDGLRRLLAERRMPYAGFSAGAVVAAGTALVGGWLSGGVPVCPPDAAEDLEELELRPGLGLVPCTVDVHAAQWGTLPRLIEAVRSGGAGQGVAIDENTMLAVADGRAEVHGSGRVHVVHRGATEGEAVVCAYRAGEAFQVS